MLHVLLAMQKRAPIRFEIAAVTMNPNFPGFDPRPLIPYMKTLGVPYFFESQELMEAAQACDPDSICSWCSRMKRLFSSFSMILLSGGILYSAARREKYNVLALAQHADDLAESFVMSGGYRCCLSLVISQHFTMADFEP